MKAFVSITKRNGVMNGLTDLITFVSDIKIGLQPTIKVSFLDQLEQLEGCILSTQRKHFH